MQHDVDVSGTRDVAVIVFEGILNGHLLILKISERKM